ncbi:hypothetical protein AVEN_239705-1 [Araneus ventricosus]|uniref:Uncharacterized protein n=1 Tax=Araneus ventricosus TaxID=182803 RepID=A0A4Y2RPD2_ARAVE|nr:hypothetical protein AVEN_260759-1 [Araneus ventricosus]GBN77216.1 hypothetical protein AVEN_239705-1 [Araneus ventricosus]
MNDFTFRLIDQPIIKRESSRRRRTCATELILIQHGEEHPSAEEKVFPLRQLVADLVPRAIPLAPGRSRLRRIPAILHVGLSPRTHPTLAEVHPAGESGDDTPRDTWEMLMAQLQHQSDMVISRKGMEGEGMTPFSPTQAIAAKTGISRSQFSLPYDAEV